MLYFTVAALVVILDQVSKRLAWEYLKGGGGVDIIDGVLRFNLSKNSGAVFGVLSGSTKFLLIVTIISVVALIYFAYRMRYAPALKRVYLGLIIGGAFGNLIDRLASGEVVDFIEMGIGRYHWPTYNVADTAVTIGAVLLIAGFIWGAEGSKTEPDGTV